MKKIYFITGNESKFKEAELILKDSGIKLIKEDLRLNEPKTLNQEQVVVAKAKQAFNRLKKPVLVDDTGIYFKEYKDFPGTYTKFLFKTLGFKGLQRLLKTKNKNAYFRCLMCYKESDKNQVVFEGILSGKITVKTSKKFNKDWEYNSIFIHSNHKKPLSEIPLEQRSKISHRKKAFDKLLKYLKNETN